MDKNSFFDFKNRKVKRKQDEFLSQKEVVLWARINAPFHRPLNFLSASLNGVKLTPAQYVKAFQSGMNAGFPDLELPCARRGYHGLYIEMKSEKGKLSEHQIEWAKYLGEEKYFFYLARSSEQAIKCLKWYLKIQ